MAERTWKLSSCRIIFADFCSNLTEPDTEFTRVGDYLQYIDSRNDGWVTSMQGNQGELSTSQAKVKLNATCSNRFHGER